jgi:hypothetical protein
MTNPNDTEKTKKVFTLLLISVCTYIGGFITGGILLCLNFRQMGNKIGLLLTALLALLGTAAYFALVIILQVSIPQFVINFILPLIPMAIAVAVTIKLQKSKIMEILDQGGEPQPIYKSVIYTILGIIPLIGLAIYTSWPPPFMDGEKIGVGELNHVLFYNKNLDYENMELVVYALQDAKHFGDNKRNIVQVTKEGDTFDFLIHVPRDKWEDIEQEGYLAALKLDLIKLMSEHDIKLYLYEHDTQGKDSLLFTKENNPEYNWLMPPKKKESDVELIHRVEQQLSFYMQLYQNAIERDYDQASYHNLPLCMAYGDNGLGVLSLKNINARTKSSFYDKEDLQKALQFISDALEKIRWVEHSDIYESYIIALNSLLINLRRVKEELKNGN